MFRGKLQADVVAALAVFTAVASGYGSK